jgi:predicted peptidase
MRRSRSVALALAVGLLALVSRAGALTTGTQSPQTLRKEIRRTVKVQYLLYLPKEYGKDKSAKWPLVLFLHGAGERGSDLNKVKAHGPPKLVAAGKEFPFILVSPQCPENERWSVETLDVLLNEVTKRYAVDLDRVYLTGLSMGGFGTWELAIRFPDRFAAIVPICGGGEPRRAGRLKNVPTWVFHGAKDPVVPIQRSQEMVDALKAAGGEVKFTIYPEAEHDSWTQTYDNPELYAWFLQKRRGVAKQ